MRKTAYELEPGLHRIRLESPGGLVVNVFLRETTEGYVLFDTGFPYSTDRLEQGFEEIGIELDDISHVFYTHTHVDHLGGGAALGDRVSARQHVWEGTPNEATENYFDWYRRHKRPAPVLSKLLPDSPLARKLLEAVNAQPSAELEVGVGFVSNTERHAFGDVVEVGGQAFRCVDLRGHDPFHCGWLDEQTGDCYCGDAVMRVISPIMPHMDDDLGLWLRTTFKARDLAIRRLLPGHGMPSTLVDASFDRSETFIRSLYDLASEALDEGLPVDPAEVAQTYLGGDQSRYHARLVVFVGTTYSLFQAMTELGYTKVLPSRHFTSIQPLPGFEEFRAAISARRE